jgi:hypothetical protein
MHTKTVGGSSETDVNELAIITCPGPSGALDVINVTVEATPRIACLNWAAIEGGWGM